MIHSISEAVAYLGIEGGGTRSTLILADTTGTVLAELTGGPANLRLMSDRQLLQLLQNFATRLPTEGYVLAGVGIGLAGARSDTDLERILKAAHAVWSGVPCYATNDLATALAAAPEANDCAARVLILSGTGSCCYGSRASGMTAKVGGRGHVIGDRGSACDIGQRALKALMAHYDHTEHWPLLGQHILASLQFTDKEDLIPWSIEANKTDIAALAMCVFSAAAKRDPVSRQLLDEAANELAEDGLTCASRLVDPAEKVQFIFNGGVLLKNPSFAKKVALKIKQNWPRCVITAVEGSSSWGAYHLAKRHCKTGTAPAKRKQVLPLLGKEHPAFDKALLLSSPTEQRNPRSLQLSTMPLAEAVELMLSEEARVQPALLKEKSNIVSVVERLIHAFSHGGRLFYVGAGTSGRLGILDASECPPTFRAPREQVQGIIAGGQRAIWSAVEGAEDDTTAGAQAIEERGITAKDVVIGIAASGRTPYVWGALARAHQLRATTVLVCFNPGFKTLPTSKDQFLPDIILAPDLGPEVLTGSTRLKSGTATKLLLNTFSTLAMTHTGKIISNLMVDLNPSNVKLRLRAVRILNQLTEQSEEHCKQALEKHGWVVKDAYQALTSPAKKALKTS
jgi:N-acetylmuramic acid 6-phosphate etherase